MKSYTTRVLKAVALGYMAFPVVYLILVALLFDIPFRDCARLLLSPLFYLLCVISVVSGYGLWEMRRWAWYVFLVANVLICYSNALLVSNYSQSHHKILAYTVACLILLGVLKRVAQEVRVPYFLPKIRWWESNPRYRLTVPVQITRADGGSIAGEILDLSLGGCFIKLRSEVLQDENLMVNFTVFGQPIQGPGVVVWRTQSTVTHPKGVGVKFGNLTRPQRKALKAITQRLKKIASLYRSSRYLMSQEEFIKRLDELQNASLDVAGGDK